MNKKLFHSTIILHEHYRAYFITITFFVGVEFLLISNKIFLVTKTKTSLTAILSQILYYGRETQIYCHRNVLILSTLIIDVVFKNLAHLILWLALLQQKLQHFKISLSVTN